MCTFPVCTSGARQYHTRHDWIYHESQMHRRQWTCPIGCAELFTSRHSLSLHIRAAHQELSFEHQSPLLLNLSERPVSLETIDQCPLCPTKLPLTDLYSHVAQHLEQLSLFILRPQDSDTEEPGENSEDSNRAYDDHSRLWNDLSTHSSSVDTRPEDTNDSNDDILSGDVDLAFEEFPDRVNDLLQDSREWETILSHTRPSMQPAQVDPLLRKLREQQLHRTKHRSTPIDKADVDIIDKYLAGLVNLGNIWDLMDECMFVTNFQGQLMKFLPQTKFDLFSSRDMIMQITSRDADLHLSSDGMNEFVQKIFDGCRKMFITSIYSELSMSFLLELVEEGLTDSGYPFCKDDASPSQRYSRKFHHSFLRNQKCFNPIFFDLGTFQLLSWDAIIPIETYKGYQSGFEVSNHEKVEIHKDQHSFPQVR